MAAALRHDAVASILGRLEFEEPGLGLDGLCLAFRDECDV